MLFLTTFNVILSLIKGFIMQKSKGVSLIELLVALSILSIMIVLAHQQLHTYVVKLRVDNEINKLQRLLFSARSFSINNGSKVTICPLNSNNECHSNWQSPISVFIDRNNNGSLDKQFDEMIISFKDKVKKGDMLIYGLNRKKIVYKPTGHLSGLSNGTFRYCPLNNHDLARGIIIARSGRLYLSQDIDGDGKDENRNKKHLECS